MKTIVAALLIAATQAGAAVKTSKVCVTNSAGFVLRWYLDDIITGEKSADTDHYPIDQTECRGVADMIKDVKEGDILMTYVDATAGTTNSVDSAIIYTADAPAVTFTCRGTTLNFSCDLNGEDEVQEPNGDCRVHDDCGGYPVMCNPDNGRCEYVGPYEEEVQDSNGDCRVHDDCPGYPVMCNGDTGRCEYVGPYFEEVQDSNNDCRVHDDCPGYPVMCSLDSGNCEYVGPYFFQ